MRSTTRCGVVVVIGLLLAAPGRAAAQTPPPVPGDTPVVWVITKDGQERKGRLVSFTPDELVVHVNGARQVVNTAEVVRVDTADSISNGIKTGAISGLVVGGLTFVALVATCDDCGGESVAAGIFAMGFYTLAGAGLGALIDHAIESRRPIYMRSAPPRLSVRPIVGLRRQGIQFRMVW